MERPTKTGVHIRWMIKRDMPDVLQIEESNSQMASPLGPWTEEDFLNILRNRTNIGMVAERHEQIVGFMVYNLQPDKLHVYNLAVHPDFLRQDVGTQLVNKLKSKLRKGRREMLEIDVREYNLRSQLFLKSQHFLWVETVRDWYEEPRKEDAYKFRYCLEK